MKLKKVFKFTHLKIADSGLIHSITHAQSVLK